MSPNIHAAFNELGEFEIDGLVLTQIKGEAADAVAGGTIRIDGTDYACFDNGVCGNFVPLPTDDPVVVSALGTNFLCLY